MVLMTKKNSKAMNHFKLRKYPIICMAGVEQNEAAMMIEDYVNDDAGMQISLRMLEIVKNELLTKSDLLQESFYHSTV